MTRNALGLGLILLSLGLFGCGRDEPAATVGDTPAPAPASSTASGAEEPPPPEGAEEAEEPEEPAAEQADAPLDPAELDDVRREADSQGQPQVGGVRGSSDDVPSAFDIEE